MPDVVMSPKQASDFLSVSGTALRRASMVYEEVFGELKRDARGGREFTAEALDRLRLAFEAVHGGRVASVGMALALLREGDELPVQMQVDPPAPRTDDAEALARAVAGELLAELRGDLQAIREENAALRLETAALREAQVQVLELRDVLKGMIAGMSGQSDALREVNRRLDYLSGVIVAEKVREEMGGPFWPVRGATTVSADVREAVRDEVEGLRVRLHAAAPASTPRQGLLARMWAAVWSEGR
ncbi:hypothetical protein DEIPH_ctg054orf0008 [Deinococcus phoenicis]|uniref:Uncharacterized protein n=1 Tax=Deinococcus phoenicis TaxID=1476583 RepID=A0A016QLJ9_9DEIO|nr:hypothetical protein [Deinococcus phoenicis]EYB67005.1 hypothetical protein DEIPH_ctg054orf0008 [Deinococcus phoenicis]